MDAEDVLEPFVMCMDCGKLVSDEQPVERCTSTDGRKLFTYTESGHQVVQVGGPVVAVHCPV